MSQLAKLTEEVKFLREKIESQEQRVRQPSYSEAARKPVPDAQFAAFLAGQDVLRVKDKSCSVVMVGVKETEGEDLEGAVKSKLQDAHLSPEIITTVFRHGVRKPQKDRIVKVRFSGPEHKHNIKLALGRSNLCAYARDDLTKTELQRDRQLRMWCRQENAKLKKKQYVVADLNIVPKRNPKPFQEREMNIAGTSSEGNGGGESN